MAERKGASKASGRSAAPEVSEGDSEAGEGLAGGGNGIELVALACGDEPGVLVLEGGLALGLVNTVLGLPWPPFVAPLSLVDRGVLEGTVATILDKLGLVPTIRLRNTGVKHTPPGSLVLGLSVRVGGETGSAWLLASDEFLRSLRGLREPGGEQDAPWLELAVTHLANADLEGIEVGDKVVFDETPALPAAGPWQVCLQWKGNRVSARWLAEGVLVAAEASTAASRIEAITRPDRSRRAESPTLNEATGGNPIRVSAGISLSSVDTVATAPLRLPRLTSMLLKAGAEPWALGDVTQFEGCLAVTITRKLVE